MHSLRSDDVLTQRGGPLAMIFVMALALILANVSAAIADPTSSCEHRAALCRVRLAAQEVSRPTVEGRCALLLQDARRGRVLHSSSSVRRQTPRLFLRVPQRSSYSASGER